MWWIGTPHRATMVAPPMTVPDEQAWSVEGEKNIKGGGNGREHKKWDGVVDDYASDEEVEWGGERRGADEPTSGTVCTLRATARTPPLYKLSVGPVCAVWRLGTI